MAPKKAKTVKRDQKHGGKNGKKEGLSGSSFFTWFMVIALLGVWTSVAVVWFDLVDYEEFLAKAKDFRYNLSEALQGKLGDYDADGDGDFDVDDAKVLLGFAHLPITEKAAKPPVKEGIKEQLKKVKEKYLGHDKEQPKEKPTRAFKDKEEKHVEKSESRRKEDEKPRETTRRTTSGRTSNGDRGKNTPKKADK
ncbi:aspartyl/asparaginyl beta-hydroxylase isoform X7 [Rhinoderma darwinii]|uniref:aspartyl/asparaginyl beta-hydroxylase isoform X7 n=1 Tax=Rhinoderma darwinii TaxID=43563 RepID=UPI003F67AE04